MTNPNRPPNGSQKMPSPVAIPGGTKPSQHGEAIIDSALEKLIRGEAVSTNETVVFLVQKLREVIAKGQAAGQRSAQLKMALEQAETEAIRMEGAATEYAKDIKRWLKMTESDQPLSETQKEKETQL